MLPEIREFILSEHLCGHQEHTRPARLSFLRIGAASSVCGEGAATFLCFANGGRRPSLVVKLAKEPRFSPGIRQEYANLDKARELLSHARFVNLPVALGLFEVDGCAVLLESFLEGRSFLIDVAPNGGYFHRRRIAREMELAVQWVSELGQRSPSRTEPVSADYIAELSAAFRSLYPTTETEDHLLGRLEAAVAAARLPMLPSHGDFYGGNLLYDHGRVGIYDWTFFRDRDVPLADLVSFVVFQNVLGMEETWSPEICVAATSRNSSFWYEMLLKECILRACDGLAIERALLCTAWGLALLAGAVRDRSVFGHRPHIGWEYRRHFCRLATLSEGAASPWTCRMP